MARAENKNVGGHPPFPPFGEELKAVSIRQTDIQNDDVESAQGGSFARLGTVPHPDGVVGDFLQAVPNKLAQLAIIFYQQYFHFEIVAFVPASCFAIAAIMASGK